MNRSRKRLPSLLVFSFLLTFGGCQEKPPVSTTGTLSLANDLELFYRVVGNGPDTVVVLNGGIGLHHGYLVEGFGSLTPGRTLVFYDQRGRGRSTVTADSALTMENDIRDLDSLRTHLHIDRLKLATHDWGGILAVLYARQHPEHVSRLLLVSPPAARSRDGFALNVGYVHDPVESAAYLAATGKGLDSLSPVDFCRRFWGFAFSPLEVTDPKIVKRVASAACDVPGGFGRVSQHSDALVRASLKNFNLVDTLKALTVPVLVVEGDGTELATGKAHTWAASLGNAREILLRGPSTFPWLGAAKGFSRASSTFLSGNWPVGALDPSHAQSTAGVTVGSAAVGGS